VSVMDKRNHFNFILLKDNPFFYCLVDQIWVHLLVSSQIQAGGSNKVGGDYMKTLHFRPMLYRCIFDKSNPFLFHLP
jgi:hypothetical protein